MTVLAQVVKQIPAKIIESLAKKFKIQTRAFSPTSHVRGCTPSMTEPEIVAELMKRYQKLASQKQ